MTPRRRKPSSKFLSTDQIDKATALLVANWKGSQGGRIALIGGAALHFYGSDRFTKDVDFISDDTRPADESSDLEAISRLSFGGRRYMAPGGIPVDVIVREDHSAELYEAALDSAEPTEEGFLIVTPEYLAAMKFDAARPKDQTDLLWMLAQGDLVNVKKAAAIIEKYCGGHRAAREFRELIAQAEWHVKEGHFDEKTPRDRSEEE